MLVVGTVSRGFKNKKSVCQKRKMTRRLQNESPENLSLRVSTDRILPHAPASERASAAAQNKTGDENKKSS